MIKYIPCTKDTNLKDMYVRGNDGYLRLLFCSNRNKWEDFTFGEK